jgi:hypothetical protein
MNIFHRTNIAGLAVREKNLTAGLGEEFSLDIPFHRAFFSVSSAVGFDDNSSTSHVMP